MAHADMAESIENAFVGQNAVGERKLVARLVECRHRNSPYRADSIPQFEMILKAMAS